MTKTSTKNIKAAIFAISNQPPRLHSMYVSLPSASNMRKTLLHTSLEVKFYVFQFITDEQSQRI